MANARIFAMSAVRASFRVESVAKNISGYMELEPLCALRQLDSLLQVYLFGSVWALGPPPYSATACSRPACTPLFWQETRSFLSNHVQSVKPTPTRVMSRSSFISFPGAASVPYEGAWRSKPPGSRPHSPSAPLNALQAPQDRRLLGIISDLLSCRVIQRLQHAPSASSNSSSHFQIRFRVCASTGMRNQIKWQHYETHSQGRCDSLTCDPPCLC
jgi:hypothetical protein